MYLGRWINIYCSMGVNNCLNCLSNCCTLEVSINRKEFDVLVKLGHEDKTITFSDVFLKECPNYEDKKKLIDRLHEKDYAVIKKGDDGYCVFLDRETRLCGIYEDRPFACSDFSNESERCKKIRKCIN